MYFNSIILFFIDNIISIAGCCWADVWLWNVDVTQAWISDFLTLLLVLEVNIDLRHVNHIRYY